MHKQEELRLTTILAVVILMAASMLACRIGGEAAQAPEAQPQEQPQVQVPTDSATLPAQPQQGTESGILFQDDFQDGQPDNWQVISTWYVQQSGDIYTFGGTDKGGAYVTDGINWSDYAFEADAMYQNGSLVLSFNFTDAARYMVNLREDGLFLVKEQPDEEYSVLTHTGPVPAGEWHRIGMKSKDGRIQVLVDDQLWIDTLDPQPISRGTIAVGTLDGSTGTVDNVLVTRLTTPLESAPLAAPPPIVDAQVVEDQFEGISGVFPNEGFEPVQQPEGGEKAPPPEPPPENQDEPPQPVPVEQGQAESDVSILDVELPLEIMQGTPFDITISMHNAGPDPAVPYTVVWLPEGTFVGCSWDIYDHQIGTDHRQTVTCQYTGYPNEGMYTWIVLADPEDALNDFDPNGNERSNMIRVLAK